MSEDPGSYDFLAREQEALADLNLNLREDDVNPLDQEQPIEPTETFINNVSSNPDLELLNSNATHALLNGDIHKSSSVPNMNGRNEEPEKIKKWREDQRKRIEEKDKAEEAKKRRVEGIGH